MKHEPTGPAPQVRRWVEERLEGVTAFEERTVPYGEARVWAVRRGDEIVAWLKRHRHREKAQRERKAYEAWLPAIGWGTPAFLGACPAAPSALLTAAAPGAPAHRAELSPDERLVVYREVGRFLAALHAVPYVDDDPVAVDDALRARSASWCAKAEDVVDPELLEGVQACFDAPFPQGLRRVPCHRDLQLHNVIVDRTPGGLAVTVIDFGQCRPDVWLSDLVKLFQLPRDLTPGAFQAFLDGYGRRLKPPEHDVLARLRALHGLATWVWAQDHGDRQGVRLGRRILEAALDAWQA